MITETIAKATNIEQPELLNQGELDKLKQQKGNCNYCKRANPNNTHESDFATVNQMLTTGARQKSRRKQFRPTHEQKETLKRDYNEGQQKKH